MQAFPGDAFDLDFSCGEEHTVKFENDDLYLLLTHYGGVRRIQFRSERFEGDLSCANDGDGIYTAEALAGKQFYYRGFRCFPGLSGYLRMHNRDLPLDAQTFLFSESVRAVMPRGDVYLRAFGSACVDGHVISLALSDGADSADENALFYDGTLCKLGRVYMKRSASDPLRPWYVSDSTRRLHLEFAVRREYRVRRRAMLLRSEVRQYFGTLSGTVELPDGGIVPIENMYIFCEEKLR